MNKRPFSVTILSWVFIAAGAIGIAYHLKDFRTQPSVPYENLWITLVRLIAIVCGVFMLRGRNWARWLALAWIAFHVVLSAFHALTEFAVHALLLALFAWILFRRPATEYFRCNRTEPLDR